MKYVEYKSSRSGNQIYLDVGGTGIILATSYDWSTRPDAKGAEEKGEALLGQLEQELTFKMMCLCKRRSMLPRSKILGIYNGNQPLAPLPQFYTTSSTFNCTSCT